MLFSSTEFLFLFLPLVLLLYYGVFRILKLGNIWLLACSILFYAWGEPDNVVLLLFSILVNYILGLLVEAFRDSKKTARFVVFLSLFFNLSLLIFFKYSNFFVDIINKVFKFDIYISEMALPIGISFFTFQAISYVIDVYRGNGSAQKNILDVGLYITFFPQLIAGPIVRYETVANQIVNRRENVEKFSIGVCRFIKGLAKKVIIANQMGIIADKIFQISDVSLLTSWLGAIAYTLQIYYDFSGYSDMAIGLGKMFGFDFNENFNYPYVSKSITEFWRRWHISLSTWFRDYVYIPLGGSRVKSVGRHIFNLFVVWFLTGLWHGASTNFIVWGLYYFVLLVIEKYLLKNYIKNVDKSKFRKCLSHFCTLVLVIFGWVIFRADNLQGAFLYLSKMFGVGVNGFIDRYFYIYFLDKIWIFVFAILFSMPVFKIFEEKLLLWKSDKRKKFVSSFFEILYPFVMFIIFLVSVSYIVKGSYNPFIYFNF